MEEFSLYSCIASEHLDCTSIFCCLLPYLKGQNAGQFLNWMFFALSEGTKRSPIFEFYGFAAAPSLASLICRAGILTSMSKFRVVYVGFSTADVIQLEPDPYLPYQRLLILSKNTSFEL